MAYDNALDSFRESPLVGRMLAGLFRHVSRPSRFRVHHHPGADQPGNRVEAEWNGRVKLSDRRLDEFPILVSAGDVDRSHRHAAAHGYRYAVFEFPLLSGRATERKQRSD